MAGICVGKLRHECPDGGGNGKPLQVYLNADGTYSGYCYRCGTYVADPFEGKAAPPAPPKKTKEQLEEELREIREEWGCQSVRGIRQEILEYLGVKIGVSETDGVTPNVGAFPYKKDGELVAYKQVTLNLDPKRVWSTGDQSDVDFFGWEQAIRSGSKRLYITEGCWDAAALIDIMKRNNRKEEYKDIYPAVVSLPHGAGAAAKDIAKFLVKIRQHFKEVMLVFDRDEAGKKAVEEVCKVAPDFMSAELPCKDANDCLQEGHIKSAFTAVMFRGAKPKNSRVMSGAQLLEKALEPPRRGLSYPWEGLTQLTRGMRFGELNFWAAGVKSGKSTILDTIGGHFIKEHSLPILACRFEEVPAHTYRNIVGKIAGIQVVDPDIPIDMERFLAAEKLVRDKLLVYDIYQFARWDAMKADIIYAIKDAGVKVVQIDPLTNLTAGMSAAEANDFLAGWSVEAAAMAKDLDVHFDVAVHLKAPDSGKDHNRGGEILANQIAGSRAMTRACHAIFGISANKDPTLPEEQRNIRKIQLLEDRLTGSVGEVAVYYEGMTGKLKEIHV